jgi:branched-chain amino acid transport system permease protein
MTLGLFMECFINGLQTGMLIVLIACGLVLVLGITKIFNFAHGEFYMIGAYITFYFSHFLFKFNFGISLFLSALGAGLLGWLSYLAVFQRIRGNLLLCAGATIGMSMALRQGALLGFGTTERGMPSVFPGVMRIGDYSLPWEKIVVIVLCLGVLLILFYVIKMTKIGKAMRAVSLDSETASLQGINVNWIYGLTVAAGCALAGVAGGIIAPILAVTPHMGHRSLLLVLIVLLVGGLESLAGAVLAGIGLGMVMSFGFQFFGGISEMIVFIVIGIFLIFKPGGILGRVIEV